MNPEIVLSEAEDAAFNEFLHQKIREFNNAHSPAHRAARAPGGVMPVSVKLVDETGQVIGGLSGSTHWGWLEVEHFFLPETLRGQGLGTRILREAEALAIRRGCRSAFLTTFSFQARFFYEKQGYRVVGSLEDYPPGQTYYWMRKDLASGRGK